MRFRGGGRAHRIESKMGRADLSQRAGPCVRATMRPCGNRRTQLLHWRTAETHRVVDGGLNPQMAHGKHKRRGHKRASNTWCTMVANAWVCLPRHVDPAHACLRSPACAHAHTHSAKYKHTSTLQIECFSRRRSGHLNQTEPRMRTMLDHLMAK